ncbi:DUF3365 domain-containing protein [Thalassotalea sp. M1531]|uniref:DUF3365 domain-containing protein n=1 Tax=Thalassotalea algicola TaxID=2716224 RepID=A0A7Y0Q5L4_9GAMM|nr:DUF3365 domain-containing protein [Thalassotalea algicola]NMP30246.1 DUF3365 domain-containing protein [Thalassotalea algicola]
MKKALHFLLFFTLIFPLISFANTSQQETEHQLNGEAKQKIQLFAKQLKSTLQAGVKQGGLVHGMRICQEVANDIAHSYSTDGWTIGRTSLKLRNTDNAADNWQRKQLIKFEKQLAEGVKPKKLMSSEIIQQSDGKQVYKFAKAIPTGKLCLNCHGSNIKPEVKSALNLQYPNDVAVGFKLGELRGAFIATKQLTN